MNIYVGNLSFEATESDVENAFGAVIRFGTNDLFSDESGQIWDDDGLRTMVKHELDYLKRHPLKMYITREPRRELAPSKKSVIAVRQVVSNVLVIK